VLHIYLSNRPEKKSSAPPDFACPAMKSLCVQRRRDVGDNEEGILWVRGDSNTPLYWNRPDKSAETIREAGWIYTGDRFVRDSDGFISSAAADDLIKISGQWVYPLESSCASPSIRRARMRRVRRRAAGPAHDAKGRRGLEQPSVRRR